MGKIMDKMLTVFAVLAGLLLLFITFSIAYTIFARFLDIPGPIWAVQFTEYSLLWMTLLGSAWVLKNQKHVSVDVVTSRLRSRSKAYLDLVHNIMGAGVCSLLCWYGTTVTWNQYQRGVTDIQVIDIPKYLILIIIPIGFLFLTVEFVRQFFRILNAIRDRKATDFQGQASGGGDS